MLENLQIHNFSGTYQTAEVTKWPSNLKFKERHAFLSRDKMLAMVFLG